MLFIIIHELKNWLSYTSDLQMWNSMVVLKLYVELAKDTYLIRMESEWMSENSSDIFYMHFTYNC